MGGRIKEYLVNATSCRCGVVDRRVRSLYMLCRGPWTCGGSHIVCLALTRVSLSCCHFGGSFFCTKTKVEAAFFAWKAKNIHVKLYKLPVIIITTNNINITIFFARARVSYI